MMEPEQVKRLIEAGLEGSVAEVSGDGQHFQAVVVCPAFEGKPLLARHRLVNEAVREQMDSGALHALSLTRLMTPAEWDQRET